MHGLLRINNVFSECIYALLKPGLRITWEAIALTCTDLIYKEKTEKMDELEALHVI